MNRFVNAFQRDTPGVLLAVFGAVLVKLAWTDVYLRYVRADLKWVLLATGVVLAASGVASLLRRSEPVTEHHHEDDEDHGHSHHGMPRIAWLLALLVTLIAIVPPPALGSFAAKRQVTYVTDDAKLQETALSATEPTSITLWEFATRAVWGDAQGLRDNEVVLTGFVVPEGDGWQIARASISCCAADASIFKAKVEGQGTPPADTWVQVTGKLVGPPIDKAKQVPPTFQATSVQTISQPDNPYE